MEHAKKRMKEILMDGCNGKEPMFAWMCIVSADAIAILTHVLPITLNVLNAEPFIFVMGILSLLSWKMSLPIAW